MPSHHAPQVETSPLRLHHHYFFIIFWVLVGSVVLYIPGGIAYIDALVLASGAATQSGLNPVDLDGLHLLQQASLWIVPMITNVVFMHSLLVLIRLFWFRRRFRRAIHDAKTFCHAQRSRWDQHLNDLEAPTLVGLNRTIPEPVNNRQSQEQQSQLPTAGDSEEVEPLMTRRNSKPDNAGSTGPHITFYESDREHEPRRQRRSSYSSYSFRRSQSIDAEAATHDGYGTRMPNLPPLMWQSSIASYSQWNETQKEELGGIEYRALKTLMVILVCYFVTFHVLGMLTFMLWISLTPEYHPVLETLHINRFWWATFTSSSAFNDLGYTLTPDSMASFRTAALPLLLMAFLIVIGNTGFPCMLRLLIWTLSKCAPHGTPLDEELQYLLTHPRRCFTLLFPSGDTWRLAAVLLLLNAIDLVIFYTHQDSPDPDHPIPTGIKLANSLFQITSTRTAGFTTTTLSSIHPSIQVSFLVMMYISAFPIAIAIRKTNVYEEKSLGIYDSDPDPDPNPDPDTTMPNAHRGLAAHIQRQLGFDLWYVMLGFFLITLTEGNRIQTDGAFSLFPVLFELVSAYGTVGLSLGYPGTATSLCSRFHWASKLIVIAMEVRGRHRGLPHALDHAILLPCDRSEEMQTGEWWWKRWLKRKGSDIGSFFSHGDHGEMLGETDGLL
ncbi:low affinity potassium transporter [Aspergillus nanangensis]|uniref:Low affinity potassium transporter n=1 Tax=Aspergillus nanangensis TaxID=2582783 RepID=A0AAD4CHB6_ASPNN|nr:low affinity potassium transporter [Aspergillus nanangensis]